MRGPGIYENIPNNVYHADKEWLSSSQIKVALSSAYHYDYFVNQGKGERKATDAKDFGSVTHKLILEPDTFFDEYAVFDTKGMDMRKKADKEKYENFAASNKGKNVITKDDFDKAQRCRDSVYSHPDARRYLEMPGISEASVYVVLQHKLPSGEVVPFKVRVRPDRLVHGTAILDLKTTKNPSKDSFCKDALAPWGYAYDVSAALYIRAIATLTGEVLPFIFIAVGNDHPHACAVYFMGKESEQKGNARLDRAINTIILSERAGVWEFQKEMEEI